MIDNLAKMVEGLDNESFPTDEKDLDITVDNDKEEPKADKIEKANTEDNEIIRKETSEIVLRPFPEWFENNNEEFSNVRQIKLSVRGIDPTKNLVFSVLDPLGGKSADGYDKRNLHLYKDADQYVVLDLDAISLDIFNNGFKIVHNTGNNGILLKCYGVKTGLIVVNCISIGDKLIPYYRHKLGKKDKGITNVIINKNKLNNILTEPADLESLQLLYRQLVKAVHEIKTNQDMVNWFVNRQKTITDINHHLQIDTVLITLLTAVMRKN